MRLKYVKGSEAYVASSEYVIEESLTAPGTWHQVFENTAPICLELGMGKGKFIMETAERNPGINYLGIERYSSVLIKAVHKMEETPLPNVRFLYTKAENLPDIFSPGEISRIYLNFSDPWPKPRHAKRRLTSPEFLARYDRVLSPGGALEFKTDNEALFDYSLESLSACGWTLTVCTRDLHNDPLLSSGNIQTEYEEKFSAMGNPIYKFTAVR